MRDGNTTPGRRPVVVVCGAGFAGLWAARRLAGEEVDVVLLDRNNYHTFYPLLYQVAAAELGPTEVAYPVRAILRKASNVVFRMADVRGVDLESRTVVTDVDRIAYDHLVLALGSVPNFFGVEGAAEHTFTLREMDQAIPLRHHLLSRFESAVFERDPEHRRKLLTFVIVGGGPTGVEYAGALAELVFGPLLEDYPTIDAEEIRIVLLEALDELLPGMPGELCGYAADRLARRGVEVRTGAVAERVEEGRIVLDGDEAIESETIVWTAGVKGDDAVGSWGVPVNERGQVEVTGLLNLEEHPEVWVAGDLAYVEQEGEPLPQVAPVAIQEGEHVARNILRRVRGDAAEPFEYDDPGMLAVIGRNAAVADFGGRTFTGFPAWIIWVVVHIAKLIGFRNRALVLVNWAWNYIRFENAVRLILPFEREAAEPDVREADARKDDARTEDDRGEDDPTDTPSRP